MLRRHNAPRDGQLGPLETRLLQALWQRGDATVRELMELAELHAAYTTVMTTLDRLYRKGLLERELEGRAFRYRPKQTEAEYKSNSVAAKLEELLNSARDPLSPISFLVDAVTQHDERFLNELERAVQQKRRELKKKGKR